MILNRINIESGAARLPWHDPVVLSTLLLLFWLLAAVVVGALYRPARQGRKVAYLTMVSFVFLALVLAAGLLLNSRHWERKGEGGERKAEMGRLVSENWSMQIAKCKLQNVNCSDQFTICNDQYAICNLQCEFPRPSLPGGRPC
jgi:hypothetical protein